MMSVLLVAVGGGAGAVCRAALSNWVKARWIYAFPLATFCINVLGSFVLGLLIAASLSAPVYALCGTGFMGGFTTFSTLHNEAAALARGGRRTVCLTYLCASYGLSLAAAMAGLMLGQ